MKAIAASLATALALVGVAWADNITPQQFSKLNARVTQLNGQVSALARTTACLRKGWDATTYSPALAYTSDGFPTLSGNLTMYVTPAQADGLTGTIYLLSSAKVASAC